MRLVAVVVLLTACDVGSVLPEGGGGVQPDASSGGGGGNTDGAVSGGGGTMKVTFTTTSAGGNYSPANVVATWIEAAGGTFVKTIDRWSNARTIHLVAWNQKAGSGDADAVSGATRNAHGQLVVTWDLKNRQNTVVADGAYTIRMELADQNSTTAGQNNQGTFTFTKGAAPETQTGLSNGGFQNVSIEFTPP